MNANAPAQTTQSVCVSRSTPSLSIVDSELDDVETELSAVQAQTLALVDQLEDAAASDHDPSPLTASVFMTVRAIRHEMPVLAAQATKIEQVRKALRDGGAA